MERVVVINSDVMPMAVEADRALLASTLLLVEDHAVHAAKDRRVPKVFPVNRALTVTMVQWDRPVILENPASICLRQNPVQMLVKSVQLVRPDLQVYQVLKVTVVSLVNLETQAFLVNPDVMDP